MWDSMRRGFRFWHCATESKLNFHFVYEIDTSLVNTHLLPGPCLDVTSAKSRQLEVSPASWLACLFLGWHPCVVIYCPADSGGMVQNFHAHLGLMLNKSLLVDLWCSSLQYFQNRQIKSSFFPLFSRQTFPSGLWSYATFVQQIAVQTSARENIWLNNYNAA